MLQTVVTQVDGQANIHTACKLHSYDGQMLRSVVPLRCNFMQLVILLQTGLVTQHSLKQRYVTSLYPP